MSVEAIRIVSLPRELNNELEVCDVVSHLLGAVQLSVKIVQMKTESGVAYRSAFVNIGKWDSTHSAEKARLLSAGSAGVNFSEWTNMLNGEIRPLNFHFDNGKPMSHIKIVAVKNQSNGPKRYPLEVDSWTSIYIPVVPSDLELYQDDAKYSVQENLSELFEHRMRLGKVSRVDIATKKNAAGQDVRSAYIHFDEWYDTRSAHLVRDDIAENGQYSCNGFYDGKRFLKFRRNRFINLKVNRKPMSLEEKNSESEQGKVGQEIAMAENI
jgi:hypothetical protein